MSSDDEVLVQVHGARPENILIMVHEVIEGLVSDFFSGIQYEYRIPCPQCSEAVSESASCYSNMCSSRLNN